MNPSINYNDYDKHYKMQTYTHTASSHTKPPTTTYGHPVYSTYVNHAPVHTSVPHEYNTNGLSRATSYGHDFPSHTYLSSPKTHMTSDSTLRAHVPYQPYNQNPPTPKVTHPQIVPTARKQSKGAHLAELNIDEITEVTAMHTSPNNTRFAFSAPDKYGLLTPQPGIVPSAGVSFFTGLKTSQYGESKDRIVFDTPHTANSTRDETSSQGTNLHMHENYGKGAQVSLLQGLKAPRTPNKGHIRFPEAPVPKSSIERRKDAFLNAKILNCLLQFLNCNDVIQFRGIFFEYRNDKEFRSIFKKKLEKLVLNIKVREDQYKFWNSLVDFRKVRNDHSLAFTQHFVRKCEFIRDITKDLDRTFPEYEFFSTEKGRDGLLKVLVAISNTIKEVGYIQGLNSIAAVFLYYLKEEESFWILVYLMERIQTKDIFKSDFERVTMLNYQLETFINYYLPSIAQLFNDQQMSLSTVTTQWFITLYSYNLSIPNIAKVLNFVFIRGVPFLIQFGLAIFSKFKNNILAMSLDEVGPFLKEELRILDDKEESLFKTALEFRVSKKLMRDLETYYKNGKPKLMLSFDARNKAVWTVLPQNELSPRRTEISRAQTDPTRVKEMKDLKKPIRTNSSSSNTNSNPKAKSPIFFQNIVNTLKVDLPDAIKNVFSKKESKEITPTINPPNSAKGSFIIQEERKPEHTPTKFETLEKEKELTSPESQNTIERNDSDTPQGSYRSTLRDYRSNTVYHKTLQSPKFQSGQFETYIKDHQTTTTTGSIVDLKPNPYFGRPKVRPQNNSLDASDLTTWSPEKEFIKQLQLNNSKNMGDGYKSSFVPSSTNSLYQEEQKSLYHSKSKYENGFRSPTMIVPHADKVEDLTPGMSPKKVYDEYYGKKPLISPKQADFRPRPYRSDNVEYHHNSGRIGHAYPMGGDFKKIS